MNIIIGGGPAGRAAALELASLEEDVTIIERNHLGGTCLNQGCMVICGLRDITNFLSDAKTLNEHHILELDYKIEYEKIAEGVKRTIARIRRITEKETKDAGIEVIYGEAKVPDNKHVEVEGEKLDYDNLIIATGARPYTPPIKGSENAINYQDILNLEETPESLIIIGSGMIAAEVANIFSILGSRVHIICRGEFLKDIDGEIRDYITRILLRDVEIHTNTRIKSIKGGAVETDKGHLEGLPFLATGMIPNSEIIDIVKKGRRGNIIVDDRMQTTCRNIYAAGDVIGGIGTTPVARMEGSIAGLNAAGIEKRVDYTYIPHAISLGYDVSYIEMGKARGEKSVEGKMPGAAGPGSFWKVLDDNTGLGKVRVDLETGTIEKVYSIAPSSRNVVAYLSLLLKLGVKTYDFEKFVETHPSTDVIYKLMRFFAKY
ncbi:MAG TPA: NAD(P)/FAD-dependent oxidoreductase [Methanothermobacter sp.]|jgi:dihydrolipoamide dehydrogenase|uniref:Dihydrolipoamide dehydrogenase n=1 Tax=Methanothermobacter tenebrarum TaxID=680118 RepID=A0ABM7YF50_9EURY|nr:NAD(P)/FAD-dependent oxidoreductase [Methanothermobacter tenebrarum]MDI6882091.1 NAD(P)/FAD-dependent oxidoreductase [Methanothermobacter sp.]MDX9692903.1 NAD(P)/FAD-dependent oxidoreductase [Methanothermobacter sp.]BDH80015.1 dihydrolipoamide dehydrogenase [Methanothermobacter tenebrarum]HHW16431.1 NAD(P)/FAD-dependent oxidoreductase [Methanothermobacter sp.]HOQ20591.1 NAD(P)/FAD-dependent oxidoreductase [Methanothermobacter sp.]